MTKLLKYLKGYWGKTITGPFFKLIEAVFELFTPIVVAWIIDNAIPRGQAGDFKGLIYGGAIILALGVFGLAFSLTAQFFASRASVGFGTNLRRELYAHVNSFSYAELDKFSTTSLITRLTSDINQCQQGVAMFIRLVLRAPFIAVGAIVMAMIIDVKLSLIFVGAAVLIAGALALIMLLTMPKYKKVQEKLDDVTRLTKENLSGARVIRAFDAQDREKQVFDKASDALSGASIKAGKLSALLNPLTYAVLNVAIIVLLYFGGKTVYYGNLTQGEIIALVNYMTQILNALVVFANLLVTFTKASASASRINEVFAVNPSMQEGKGAIPNPQSPAIELKGVSFTYQGSTSPSIVNANVTVDKGTSVGIIGGTGSGKTTLVNLMTRLYDASEGEVLVFGENVKNYTNEQLRSLFGVAPQKAVLFEGTIADNVRWGKQNATDEEIDRALRISQSAEFVYSMKDGLDTTVNHGGKNLSGGQRQRLTIARATVSMPDILVLDDSSSALDFATDAKLRKALESMRLENGLTTVTVSQRATSIKYCDLIIVLDDGKIVGKGTHDDLVKSCEVYREICLSQLKGENEK